MTATITEGNVRQRLESLLTTPDDQFVAAYQELVEALWQDGVANEVAIAVAADVLRAWQTADDRPRAALSILIGLLVQSELPATDGPLATFFANGLSRFLDVWERTPVGTPLSLALQFLVAHFPSHRGPICAAAHRLDLSTDDRSRLDRALAPVDDARADIGRVFPFPAAWTIGDDGQSFDQAWVHALTPDEIVQYWHRDTLTVLGHNGAKAHWSVVHEAPAPVTIDTVAQLHEPDADRSERAVAVLRRHLHRLRCSDCGGRLAASDDRVSCSACDAGFSLDQGILNLASVLPNDVEVSSDLLIKLADLPTIGLFYEAYARPAFLRLCGSNWDYAVTPEREAAYLAEHVRPAEGPVLDLAAGAGSWTAMLAAAVPDRDVIALDMASAMLSVLRKRLPEVPGIIASAARLPFADASLGAVNCWNSLQAFPLDAKAAVAEVGRCLQPGGTFTVLTYAEPTDRIYRYLQACHYLPQHTDGLRLFAAGLVEEWLEGAGLRIRHAWRPGTFTILTAERTP